MLFSNGVRNVTIMPGALFLPIGIGLWHRREFCRRAAVWCVWAGFIFVLIMLGWLFGKAFGLFAGLDVVAKILGQPMNSTVGAILTFLIFAGEVILLPWMFLVLMRDEVRAACREPSRRPRPLVEWGLVVMVVLIMAGGVRLPLPNRLQTGIYFTNPKPVEKTAEATNGISGESQAAPLPPGYQRGQAPPIPPAYKLVQTPATKRTVPSAFARVSAPVLQFRWVANPGDTNSPVDVLPDMKQPERTWRLLGETVLEGSVLGRAGWRAGANGTKEIVLEFTKAGQQQFALITSNNIGRGLAIVWNDKVLTAPRIASSIDSPTANLSGNWQGDEWRRLLTSLTQIGGEPASWEFGEVRERVLPQTKDSKQSVYLNLASNHWMTNESYYVLSVDFATWARNKGADLTGGFDSRQNLDSLREHNPEAAAKEPEPIPIIKGLDLIAIPAGTNAWGTVSPVEVARNWDLMTKQSENDTYLGKKAGVVDTYFFRTRENDYGLLQVLGFSDNPRGVKILYKLVQNEPVATNTPPAAEETWSPKLAAGEKPDLQKIRADIKSLMNAGDYVGALQRQLWYFHHAAEFGEANPVRLSFGIADWAELGRHYPPARQVLLDIRDQDAQQFATGGGSFALFQEVANLNRELQDEGATLTLFRSIESRDPELARSCYFVVEDQLVNLGEYAVCARFIADFQTRFEQVRDGYRRTSGIADHTPGVNLEMVRKNADRTFIKTTRTLIEILVGVNRSAEAEEIQKRALAVLNVQELQSAVSDSEESLRSKRTRPINQ